MREGLLSILQKLWLKKKSIPIMFFLLAAVFFTLSTMYDAWEWIEVPMWGYNLTAVVLFVVWVTYVVLCFFHDQLRRAPRGTVAVLFCIDAESEQLYKMAKFKLVDQFNLQVKQGRESLYALCVSKAQVSKYDLQDSKSTLALLRRTNCAIIVYVRYMADDVSNAENYELRIDCGVSHPKFNDKAKEVISQDLRTMKKAVGKQRFSKTNAITVFSLTAQTLVCAIQYILGFVYLLSENNRHALDLLLDAKKNLPAIQEEPTELKKMADLVDDRIYYALCQIGQEFLVEFESDNSLEHLEKLNQILVMANLIRPETYFYNMNMAYVQVALNHDAVAAKECIDKCKMSKENKDWLYSDAFLSAYCGHAPTTILAKYAKAFKVPYKNLLEIVQYIEFVIEAEPEKVALHLAAGLVYEQIKDAKLMRQHLSIFLSSGKGINQKTRTLLESKISAGECGVQCNQNCVKCAG